MLVSEEESLRSQRLRDMRWGINSHMSAFVLLGLEILNYLDFIRNIIIKNQIGIDTRTTPLNIYTSQRGLTLQNTTN